MSFFCCFVVVLLVLVWCFGVLVLVLLFVDVLCGLEWFLECFFFVVFGG